MLTEEILRQQRQMGHLESVRRKKACFVACDICGKCSHYTSEYHECNSCYPRDSQYREITKSWEHCNCRMMPWEDFVDGRFRSNLVLPSIRDKKVSESFKRRMKDADKPNLVKEMRETLRESGIGEPSTSVS
jgi:hypothetical protein